VRQNSVGGLVAGVGLLDHVSSRLSAPTIQHVGTNQGRIEQSAKSFQGSRGTRPLRGSAIGERYRLQGRGKGPKDAKLRNAMLNCCPAVSGRHRRPAHQIAHCENYTMPLGAAVWPFVAKSIQAGCRRRWLDNSVVMAPAYYPRV
jgi:hypothetical protein